jgi:hypothetical protein
MATRRPRRDKNREFAPGTRRLQRRARQTPPYKVIAVGVYDDQAASLDRTATALQQAGFKANRSFVVQALVRRLQQEIEGLTADQLLQMFIERYVRRPLSKVQRDQPEQGKLPVGNESPTRRQKAG